MLRSAVPSEGEAKKLSPVCYGVAWARCGGRENSPVRCGVVGKSLQCIWCSIVSVPASRSIGASLHRHVFPFYGQALLCNTILAMKYLVFFNFLADASPEAWSELVGIPLPEANGNGISSSSSSSSGRDPRFAGFPRLDIDGDRSSSSGSRDPRFAGLPRLDIKGANRSSSSSKVDERNTTTTTTTSSSSSSSGRATSESTATTSDPGNSTSSSRSSSTSGGGGSESERGLKSRGAGPYLKDEQPVSFLLLSDPKFKQARRLMAGLDFAFPEAAKVSYARVQLGAGCLS